MANVLLMELVLPLMWVADVKRYRSWLLVPVVAIKNPTTYIAVNVLDNHVWCSSGMFGSDFLR